MSEKLMETTAQIVSNYLSRNEISSESVPALIHDIAEALRNVEHMPTEPGDHSSDTASVPNEPEAAFSSDATKPLVPAVPIEESLGDDFIICLEDGKRLKMLKRYIRRVHNLSPDEYRARWGLPADYPMVAPVHAEKRSRIAKASGFAKKKSVRDRVPATA